MSPIGHSWRSLHVAMIGQKGLPATYGGVEHHVEQIGRRLAARGHRVTVFSRRSYSERPLGSYLGMDIRDAPTIASKHLDAIVHSATSTALAMTSGCDIVHYHALGPGLLAPLARYGSPKSVVLTVHGLDHQRGKWSLPARTVLRLAHWMSARVPDETIVVSETLQRDYAERFGRDVRYIPNGVDLPTSVSAQILTEFELEPQRYLLFVGRMVPEKAPAALLEAFRDLDTDLNLVLAGGSSFTDSYTEDVRRLAAADERVHFLGYVHGDRLKALYQYARLFVLPSVLEGLPLTLLEALSHGVPVVASDIPPHREVVGESASGHLLFHSGDLSALRGALAQALTTEPDAAELRRFRDAILAKYDWDAVTDALEQVYLSAARPRS